MVKIVLLFAALGWRRSTSRSTKPRLRRPACARRSARAPRSCSRRLVQGEILFVAGALFAAAVLTSLPPPACALARVKNIAARVGPGPVSKVVEKGPYSVRVTGSPNKAAVNNDFAVTVTKDGQPVRGAQVVTRFDMLDMEMADAELPLPRGASRARSRSPRPRS